MNLKLRAYGILHALSLYEKEDEKIDCLAAALETLVREERRLVSGAHEALRSVLEADRKGELPRERLKRARGAAGLGLYTIETAEFWRAYHEKEKADQIAAEKMMRSIFEPIWRRCALAEFVTALDRAVVRSMLGAAAPGEEEAR